ncbi:MAG: hypothetical protein GX444_01970 [Myxococcales bacterium]|nr:hypothetical protein [Myxococcales bacterium]
MFGLGAGEILIIAILILVLFAAGRLPAAARKAGQAYRVYRDVDRKVQDVKRPANWVKIIDIEETKPGESPNNPAKPPENSDHPERPL